MVVNFRSQNYSKIKKSCLEKGVLFEDVEFPANEKSLYFDKVDPDILWKRPKELCKAPRLVVDGATCDDLVTGEIKSTWFITACTALAHEPKLWNKVIPDIKNQEFSDTSPYAGIFRFNFWRFGQWIEVVIDDRLPTKEGQLIFIHSNQKNEFWSALLEKAYAKLFGDYQSMTSGQTSDALVDFTGGLAELLDLESYDLEDENIKKMLFKKLEAAYEKRSLMTCVIEVAEDEIGEDGPEGLVLGQGYNITMVKTFEIQKTLRKSFGETLCLIRLFNPWSGREWTGHWSDESDEIKRLSLQEWERMGIQFGKDGEFCMEFDDFLNYFTKVDICHFVNTNFFTLKKSWYETLFFGEWSISGRNGGNDPEIQTFLANPQYMFDLPTIDSVMISVEQEDVTQTRVAIRENKNNIGFYIYKVESNREYRLHLLEEQVFQSDFLYLRNVFGSCILNKGRYVVFPCCEQPPGASAVGLFLLRFYSTCRVSSKELKLDCPTSNCCSSYKLVTTVFVKNAEGLQMPPSEKGTLDPFVVVKCEGTKARSDVLHNEPNPTFNFKCTFYRKKPNYSIFIEVYCKKTVFDVFLGEARIDMTDLTKDEESCDEKSQSAGNSKLIMKC
ncbi:calpain-5-like isoform X2 [Biomphalaria glabrata]|uniref:Calpain-5-like isoform X2 n=1 Tax=Biomphalaria glabrata TaxID=6526 RepID=A0A9W2ZDF8_BIOGL|nr:calpain-5-like isoform X2 [Biomphalaria glabrata]